MIKKANVLIYSLEHSMLVYVIRIFFHACPVINICPRVLHTQSLIDNREPLKKLKLNDVKYHVWEDF